MAATTIKQVPPRYYLSGTPKFISGATDVAAAKAGYTPVILAWALAAPGKFQSDATSDLTDTLPAGTMIASPQVPYLLVGEDGKKINVTGGTGFAIYSYFKTPSTSNASFN